MARSLQRTLIEATVIGIILIIVVYVIQMALSATGQFSVKVPEACNRWNDKHVMEITIFLSGALFHIAFEYTGLNKWFAESYN